MFQWLFKWIARQRRICFKCKHKRVRRYDVDDILFWIWYECSYLACGVCKRGRCE